MPMIEGIVQKVIEDFVSDYMFDIERGINSDYKYYVHKEDDGYIIEIIKEYNNFISINTKSDIIFIENYKDPIKKIKQITYDCILKIEDFLRNDIS